MRFAFLIPALILASPAAAQQADLSAFKTGPVFEEFGPHAPVESMTDLPAYVSFSVAFDVADAASEGQRHRSFESVTRFINMHVANGVDPAQIRVALVVHGKASLDLLNNEAWAAKERGGEASPDVNPSAAMLRTMIDYGVDVVLCGQSAAANGIAPEELIEGVRMSLSAMTAHAVLQQNGYTVNPF